MGIMARLDQERNDTTTQLKRDTLKRLSVARGQTLRRGGREAAVEVGRQAGSQTGREVRWGSRQAGRQAKPTMNLSC